MFVEYRALLKNYSDTIHNISDIGDTITTLGTISPDNPLSQGVYNALSNSGNYSIFCSITCNTNDISYDDSFSEHFMLNPSGGGIGYIGSTWLDYPSLSIVQNEEFFRLIFQEKGARLGAAFVISQ